MRRAGLRQPRVQSDNLAFVPATLLPLRADWQRVANALPAGSALFVVPSAETPLKQVMRRVAWSCQHRRHPVAAISYKRFGIG